VSGPVGGGFAARQLTTQELSERLPNVGIGYLLALATLVGEVVAVARNPGLAQAANAVPPLEIYLPSYLGLVYWLVCVHRYHTLLKNVPGWNHPISPARSVGFHFIPVYFLYWIFRWPAAIADFVNFRLQAPAMKKWTVGVLILASLLSPYFLDRALGVAIMFFSCTYISGFMRRAFAHPAPLPG